MDIREKFSDLAKWFSRALGSTQAFLLAILAIIIWTLSGPIYHFSDTWQLVINTATTIVTFLMVFLIQNTQNRDTVAIHLKLDEIIRAMKDTHNEMLQIEQLSDDELEELHKRYENLALDVRKRIRKGKGDQGVIEIKK